MPIATAKRILALAKDGLKIVIVGAAPDRVEGSSGSDAELRAIIAELLAQPTVSRVATEADVPAKLAALGVRPDAAPAAALDAGQRAPRRRRDRHRLLLPLQPGLRHDRHGTVAQQRVRGPVGLPHHRHRHEPLRGRPGRAFDQQVTLKGSGTPYLMNTESGEITPIAQYSTGPGTVTVRVVAGPRRVDDRRARPPAGPLRRGAAACTS